MNPLDSNYYQANCFLSRTGWICNSRGFLPCNAPCPPLGSPTTLAHQSDCDNPLGILEWASESSEKGRCRSWKSLIKTFRLAGHARLQMGLDTSYVQEQWWFQARWVDRPLEKWSVSGVSAPRSSTSPSSWSDIGIVSLKDRSSHFWLSKMPKPLRLEKLHPGILRLWDCMWTQAILRPRLSGLPHLPGSPTSM